MWSVGHRLAVLTFNFGVQNSNFIVVMGSVILRTIAVLLVRTVILVLVTL